MIGYRCLQPLFKGIPSLLSASASLASRAGHFRTLRTLRSSIQLVSNVHTDIYPGLVIGKSKRLFSPAGIPSSILSAVRSFSLLSPNLPSSTLDGRTRERRSALMLTLPSSFRLRPQSNLIRTPTTLTRNISTTSTSQRSLTLRDMHDQDGPPKRKPRRKSPISGHPQQRGTVLKVLIRKPKKPNSANRRFVDFLLTFCVVVLVLLSTYVRFANLPFFARIFCPYSSFFFAD